MCIHERQPALYSISSYMSRDDCLVADWPSRDLLRERDVRAGHGTQPRNITLCRLLVP
jgi:hypothetical protein